MPLMDMRETKPNLRGGSQETYLLIAVGAYKHMVGSIVLKGTMRDSH